MTLEAKLTALAEAIGTDVKALQQGKADTDHNHDDRYYTKAEIDSGGGSVITSRNIDGGSASSIYLPIQVINGGNASG